jgi:oxygen-independent coproporphyrinogen-3 oxidase
MPDLSVAPVASLYVHVPFCAQKCEYCAFFSEASSGELINRYVHALQRELEIVATDLRPQTIFFGGGTPSILNLRQWESVLQTMARCNLQGAPEFTVECNPATVSLDKAKLLRSFGVNRVSMGVQSLDEALLDRLGRVHSREMVFKSFDTLRQAGFDNVNIDLMFAIPGQTMEIWRATLNEALALGSEHLSSYEVIYEEDTPLFAQMNAGEFDVDEDLACDMFEELVERSAAAGFRQYEVANFARDVRRGQTTPGYQLTHCFLRSLANTTSTTGAAAIFMGSAPVRLVTCGACGPKTGRIPNFIASNWRKANALSNPAKNFRH